MILFLNNTAVYGYRALKNGFQHLIVVQSTSWSPLWCSSYPRSFDTGKSYCIIGLNRPGEDVFLGYSLVLTAVNIKEILGGKRLLACSRTIHSTKVDERTEDWTLRRAINMPGANRSGRGARLPILWPRVWRELVLNERGEKYDWIGIRCSCILGSVWCSFIDAVRVHVNVIHKFGKHDTCISASEVQGHAPQDRVQCTD